MLTLEVLARNVVANWSRGDLASAVRELDQHLAALTSDREVYSTCIARARATFADDNCEIDNDPLVSAGDEPGACFVCAWRWIRPIV